MVSGAAAMNGHYIAAISSFVRRKFFGSVGVRRIVMNTGWLFADRILRLFVGLFVTVWVARYLGPSQFGSFNYAFAFVALFSALANLGLDNIVVREIVRNPVSKDEILGTAFVLKLAGGAVAVITTIVTILLLRPHDGLTQWLVGIVAAGMVFQAFDTIDLWFQAQVKSQYTVLAKDVVLLVLALVKVILVRWQASLIAFAWASLAEIVFGAIGLSIAYRVSGSPMRDWYPSLRRARGLLLDSWPVIISGCAIMIYMRIGQVMLGDMAGENELGLYSVAARLSEIWYFIPTAIVSSVSPYIIGTKEKNETLYYRRVEALSCGMIWLALFISVPTTCLSGSLIGLLFGPKYVGSGPILAIHIWGAVFVFLGVAQGVWDLTENLMRVSLQRTLIGAMISVLANLNLIPRYGGIGAAVATVASYAVSAYIGNLFHKRTRRMFLLQTRSVFRVRALVDWT
jgi:O-antigen/teichoic acid export membrane protein